MHKNTRLGEGANTSEDRIWIECDFNRLENWTTTNEMNFKRDKYKVLQLDKKNWMHICSLTALCTKKNLMGLD